MKQEKIESFIYILSEIKNYCIKQGRGGGCNKCSFNFRSIKIMQEYCLLTNPPSSNKFNLRHLRQALKSLIPEAPPQ